MKFATHMQLLNICNKLFFIRPEYSLINDITPEDMKLRRNLKDSLMRDPELSDFSFILGLIENDLDRSHGQIYIQITDSIVFYEGNPILMVRMGSGNHSGKPRFIRDSKKLTLTEIRKFLDENKFRKKFLPTNEELKLIKKTLIKEDNSLSYLTTTKDALKKLEFKKKE